MQLFVDGHLVDVADQVRMGNITTSQAVRIGIGCDGRWDWHFDGLVDEVRIWRKALTPQEVWEGMHHNFDDCQSELLTCIQFNEVSGNALDPVGGHFGTVTGATRVVSTCPTGPGAAQTLTEVNGPLNFASTDLVANYLAHDTADVTATRIDLAPYGSSGISPTYLLLDDQYWAVNRFERTGPYLSYVTFTTNEDIDALDDTGAYDWLAQFNLAVPLVRLGRLLQQPILILKLAIYGSIMFAQRLVKNVS